MSELKVRPYTMLPSGQCYDRDEADKVIAEKDAEIAQLQAMLEERNKQIGELKEERRWRKVSEELPEVEEDCGEIFLVAVAVETEKKNERFVCNKCRIL